MHERSASQRNRFAITAPSPHAGVDAPIVSLLQPDSIEAEQYRCLRHSLLRLLRAARCNVIAVSSPCRGSGTTTTAINLAIALEEPGVFRVLLVDADLRAPAIAERLALGAVQQNGLDTALADWSLRLRDLVRPFPEPYSLAILPTAERRESAGKLTASPRFGVLMHEAREQYDFVIVDTPPLVPSADCRAIAPWIDGFVVVVGAHETRREELAEGLNAMREEQVLGLVFNGDDGFPWLGRRRTDRNN